MLRINGRFGNENNIIYHFNDGAALNKDGSWKHGYRKLTNAEKEYLTNEGWNIATD